MKNFFSACDISGQFKGKKTILWKKSRLHELGSLNLFFVEAPFSSILAFCLIVSSPVNCCLSPQLELPQTNPMIQKYQSGEGYKMFTALFRL